MDNLQEAYFGVYIQDQVDLWVSELVEEGYDIDQYTDDELLEAFVIERKNEDPKGVAHKAGVNKPDAWGAPTEFGKEATRNSLASGMKGVRKLQKAGVRINRHHRNKYLAHKVHQGWSKAAENSPHQTPEQKTRRSKLINKDLGSFRKNLSKTERDKDVPFVKKAERAVNKKGEFSRDSESEQTPRQKRLAKLQAAQRERNAQKGVTESYDLFDYLLEYLIAEGYADNNENAIAIMANMSEDWKQSIMEADSSAAFEARRQARLRRQRKKEGRTSDGGDFGHDYSKPAAQREAEQAARWKAYLDSVSGQGKPKNNQG